MIFRIFITFMIMSFSGIALGQDTPVPLDQIVKQLMDLITNGKAMGVLGIMVAIMNLIIGLLKTNLLGGWLQSKSPKIKAAILVVVGQIVAILTLVTNGVGWVEALIAGLFTSGGAVAIYEIAIKPFLKKKEANLKSLR